MKRLLFIILSIVLLNISVVTSSSASAVVERKDFEQYFAEYTTGTIVIYDETKDQYTVFNDLQSTNRLSPCSTFKIYNSMAGLETGVLDQKDENTVLKWNGTPSPQFPAWNRDQTLSSATKNSVVWYFQEVATRIGTEKMQGFLNKIEYGNRDISDGLTTFWLRSSLQISAREQVDLLYKLYSGKLPVSPENVMIVKKNITLSEDNDVRFMGKTGSGLQDGKWILGWFVGCVEKQGKSYFFAVNIQAPDDANGIKAREITKLILKDLDIL